MRWLWKKSIDDEVGEELDFHLEMRTREYVARGLDPAAARQAALRRFGDLERVRSTCRDIGRRRDKDMRRREYFGELRQDVTFALRQLASHPAFSLIAVLTLALGIGATTAIFSVVNAVVLRPLPVPRPDQLMYVFGEWNEELTGVAAGGYVALEEAGGGVFSKLGAIQFASFILSERESAERTVGARVTASYFDVFGVAPAHGRVFRADEDQPGREQVVVLSHRLWERRFGADPAILGREIRMNGLPYVVLGVMPPAFDFQAASEELWVPIAFTPDRRVNYDAKPLDVIGRLREGATREQATQVVESVAQRLRQIDPVQNDALDFRVDPYMEQFVGDYRTRLFVLLGAVGMVLLIACGNVANLLLARGAARWREVAIRSALGASRGRIVRQLLTESAVLSLVSAGIGLLLAWWGIRVLVALVPEGVPRVEQTSLDGKVLAFTLAVSLLSSFVFGLAPALRAARTSVSQTLKEGGRGSAGTRGRDWLRSTLISAEVALSVLLLVGAGLLIRSALELQRVRPGFEPRGVISARLSLPPSDYAAPERILATLERITQEVSQSPGVRSVALAAPIPMGKGVTSNGLLREGEAFSGDNVVQSLLNIVTPEYFRTMNISIVRGRGLLPSDRRGAQKVMVVNERLAELLYPGQDPIGRMVNCCESSEGVSNDKVIVGVAGNLRSRGLAGQVEPEFYLPPGQVPDVAWDWIQRSVYLVARSEGDPEALVPGIRSVVTAIDPNVPVYDVRTMEDRMAGSLATARFNTLLLSLLGVIGLILSAVGIYGVVAYFVTQRTPEIGMRMALGATPRHVVRLVLRQAALPVTLGVLLGLLASAAATRVLSAYLVGVEPMDPLTLLTVVAVLAAAALLASVVPALRAAAVEPKDALQEA